MPIDSDTFKKGLSKPPKNGFSKEKLKVAIEELLDDCKARTAKEIVDKVKKDVGFANQGNDVGLIGMNDDIWVQYVIEILNEMVNEGKLESSDVETTNGHDRYYIKKSCL